MDIDATGFSFEGNYAEDKNVGQLQALVIVFPKDLKQAVLNMVVSGSVTIPMFMQPKDGNYSDMQILHNVFEKVKPPSETDVSRIWRLFMDCGFVPLCQRQIACLQ